MRPVPWNNPPANTGHSRRGFTLIELLIAISIFVILLAVTVGTLQSTQSEDRVRESSRVIQAFFEGARSRAFKTPSGGVAKAHGVRLLLDEDDFTIATGLIYISERTPVRGKIRFPSSADQTLIQQYRGGSNRLDRAWSDLVSRGEFSPESPSVRIQIPPTGEAGNSRKYLISSENFSALVATNRMRLATDYHQDPPPSTPVGFELFLAPSVVGDPVPLPKGTVIDLEASKIPDGWPQLKGFWQANTSYDVGDFVRVESLDGLFFKCVASTAGSGTSGTSGSGTPSWDTNIYATTTDNELTWRTLESPELDIMFSPRGSVIGREAAAGIISLVVADRNAMFNQETGAKIDTRTNTENEGKFRLVNIFTQSGTITTSHPDFTGNFFNYAVNGSEAQ